MSNIIYKFPELREQMIEKAQDPGERIKILRERAEYKANQAKQNVRFDEYPSYGRNATGERVDNPGTPRANAALNAELRAHKLRSKEIFGRTGQSKRKF